MKQLILEMVQEAERTKNYVIISYVKRLLDILAVHNVASSWRKIGTELAMMYTPDSWVHEELELWDYEV